MIHFAENKRGLILEYTPEFDGPGWFIRSLRETGRVTVSRVFRFDRNDLLGAEQILDRYDDRDAKLEEFRLRFGTVSGQYYTIPGRRLGIRNDVMIKRDDISLQRKTFVAERNISIFGRIAALKDKGDSSPIVVGGNDPCAISVASFEELLAKFPTTGELDRYALARVEAVVGESLQPMRSAREAYERYLSRRASLVGPAPLRHTEVLQSEIEKYRYLRDTISDWLEKGEAYSEADWQRQIVKVILLLFPKYVAVLESVRVPDLYSAPGTTKNREIDICLVDVSGNIDVIEIKKPFENAILGRSLYRDNHVPTRELTGSIVQTNKYIFHLSKWGMRGERELTGRYADRLPPGLGIRITNPKGIIVMGRDPVVRTMRGEELDHSVDLEVIKRQYADMIDILTYDDLLRRLNNILASLQRRADEADLEAG